MAVSLGLKGFVKNLHDESVYIEAEGTELQIKYFVEWCYNGPNYASVKEVIIENTELKGFQFFDITH